MQINQRDLYTPDPEYVIIVLESFCPRYGNKQMHWLTAAFMVELKRKAT